MKTVLIVDDQKMIREIFETYLRNSGRYEPVQSISNAKLALPSCRRRPVDLILMDVVTEADESGFEAARQIKEEFPRTKIIIVTSMLDYDYLEKARNVHADSLWFKETGQELLLDVIDRTMAGESVFPDRPPEVQIGNAVSSEFTKAEIRVLRLLVEGMTYKEISSRLYVTPDCVKAHVSSMLSKTGYKSKTKLAAVIASKRLIVNGF